MIWRQGFLWDDWAVVLKTLAIYSVQEPVHSPPISWNHIAKEDLIPDFPSKMSS